MTRRTNSFATSTAAAALVFPAEEDFGIVPVEAQAAGAPVVALGAGGALDTVLDGISGVLVDTQTPEDFAVGIQHALNLAASDWTHHLDQFSAVSFREAIRAWGAGRGNHLSRRAGNPPLRRSSAGGHADRRLDRPSNGEVGVSVVPGAATSFVDLSALITSRIAVLSAPAS